MQNREALEGKNPLKLDSRKPRKTMEEYMYSQNRFKRLISSNPETAKELLDEAQEQTDARWQAYEYLAKRTYDNGGNGK